MSNGITSPLAPRKAIFVALGVVVLVAAWWAFRPEKLFINKTVNEAAPFQASGGPQPAFTGTLEDGAQNTVGRATIFKTSEGRYYLRISGLAASTAQFEVALKGAGPEINLGALQSPSEQKFDLAASVDPNQYNSVVIYNQHAGTFATAMLQPF